MSNLRITEIRAFVPSKNFEISKQFYQDLGFTMDSDDDGIAYFHFENVSFLLQDYCVAMDAMAEFLNERNASASQLEFVTMIVNYLTQDGVIERSRLYEAPFTSITATGPDSIFENAKIVRLFNVIDDIKFRAVA